MNKYYHTRTHIHIRTPRSNYFLKDSNHNGNCDFNGNMYDLFKYDCIIKSKFHKNTTIF